MRYRGRAQGAFGQLRQRDAEGRDPKGGPKRKPGKHAHAARLDALPSQAYTGRDAARMWEHGFARKARGDVAQLVERLLCKQDVHGSNPCISTMLETSVP